MKRVILIVIPVIALVMCLLFVLDAHGQENIIQDPSLESCTFVGGVPTSLNWLTNNSVCDNNAYSGTYSIMFGSPGITQVVSGLVYVDLITSTSIVTVNFFATSISGTDVFNVWPSGYGHGTPCEFQISDVWDEYSCTGVISAGNLRIGIWRISGLDYDWFDEFNAIATILPETQISSTTSAIILLSSGNQFIVNYAWTFGEMAITALLAIVVVVFCARWMYDVVIQLWSMRGDNDSI